MRNNAFHDTIAIRKTLFNDKFTLEWVDEYGGASEHICYVFGFDNAVRVANGIAHEQCEFVTHPCYDSDEVTEC